MWKSHQKNDYMPFLRENQHFFRQINVFAKEVTEELISRKMSVMIAFYSTTHIVGDRTFSVISHLLFHDILTKIRKNNYKSPNYYLQIDFTRNIKMWSPPEICKTQRPYCAHCLGTLAWRKKKCSGMETITGVKFMHFLIKIYQNWNFLIGALRDNSKIWPKDCPIWIKI